MKQIFSYYFYFLALAPLVGTSQSLPLPPKRDTVKVILYVCDTTQWSSIPNPSKLNITSLEKGYVVRDLIGYTYETKEEQPSTNPAYSIKQYLTIKRKPVPKNWRIVKVFYFDE